MPESNKPYRFIHTLRTLYLQGDHTSWLNYAIITAVRLRLSLKIVLPYLYRVRCAVYYKQVTSSAVRIGCFRNICRITIR